MGTVFSSCCHGRSGADDNSSGFEAPGDFKKNSAFVFIKPHAVTNEAKELVRQKLTGAGITVVSEGDMSAEKIDREQLIDNHYGAIAAKAMRQSPSELTVQPKAQEEFKKTFGLAWAEALSQGVVYNSVEAAAKLGLTYDGLGTRWRGLQKNTQLLKFGGGFYCGKIDDIFVLNGFYMDLRKAFTAPGASIHYFVVDWPSNQLSWSDFRGKLLGGTDPKAAAEGSIRNQIYNDWKALRLEHEPNTGENGVHASASPLEGMAERANWLGASLSTDYFGKALLAAKIPLETVQSYTTDPLVTFEGRQQSLFDLLEDLDSKECLEKICQIAGPNP